LSEPSPRPVAPLLDNLEARLLLTASEREYRETLFRDFVKFCRDAGAWVISPPFERRCRVLVPDGSTLLERLAELPRFPVVKLPNVSHRLQGGRFITVTEIQVTLWRA
jgi:hypothetical protein